jgi:uncharacterized membrane protein YdjX (TVP38/TMEM64 family)
MRLVWILLGMAVLVMVPFIIWGSWWEAAFSLEGAKAWLAQQGPWAWLAGIGLLVADLALPVPGSVVMSALGWLYGWFWGGLAGAGGSFLSGIIAYALCRCIGDSAARKILGEKDFAKSQQLAESHGLWFIALSRALPILPEVTTCAAGLTRVPLGRFSLALACGSLPTGFLYAALGATHAGWAFGLSLLLPVALWALSRRLGS